VTWSPVHRTAARDDEAPLVSVVLTTRDRPRLLTVALACYAHQTYARRELIVVDDGDRFPADADAVAAVGGRLIRVPTGTPLGTKLNRGLEQARGLLCQKMDDDDWYAPGFLGTMIGALRANAMVVCRPTIAFNAPFLFFDISRWEIRRSADNNAPGATLLFAREDWREHPFRAVPGDEDLWFYLDQSRSGVAALPVRAPGIFIAVRHRGSTTDREHTWTRQWNGRALEDYLLDRPMVEGGPEALVAHWALDVYRELRRDHIGS
jgi:glycosyltransferase involved in cell wall biosynthesis